MKNNPGSLQHRAFLTPIWLVGIAGVLAFSFAVFFVWEWATADSTTVIVIRHAEKEAGAQADPPLSAAGEARAALLAQMFGGSQGPGRIDALYISSALRNRMTAAPLAARLGITPIVAPADDSRDLVRRVLREHRGGRVMIVSHLNTMPELVATLADRRDVPAIDEQNYATMYIVTVPRIGRPNLLRLSY
jgi:broad specificity phosphatase PhoE